MAVTPPRSIFDEYYGTADFPPLASDNLFTKIVDYYSTGGGYQSGAYNPDTWLQLYNSSGQAGTSGMRSKPTRHWRHTEDGTLSSFVAMSCYCPYYITDGSTCQLIFKVESVSTGKYLRIRLDMTTNDGGISGGDCNCYLEDSEGISHPWDDEGGIDWNEQLYFLIAWYASGDTYIKVHNVTTQYIEAFYFTDNLFAFDEEIWFDFSWTCDDNTTMNRYCTVHYMDFDIIVNGPVWSWMDVDGLPTPYSNISATQDNSGTWGVLYWAFNETLGGSTRAADFWEDWEMNPATTWYNYWGSTYWNIDPAGTPPDHDYWVRTKITYHIAWGPYIWYAGWDRYQMPGIMYKSGTIRMTIAIQSAADTLTIFKNGVIVATGTVEFTYDSYSYDPTREYVITFDSELIHVQVTSTNGVYEFDEVSIPFYDIFDREEDKEFYFTFRGWSGDIYSYQDTTILNASFPGNTDFGQSPTNILASVGEQFEVPVPWTKTNTEHVLYFRRKIINSANPNDEMSLQGIDPSRPSDIGLPLRPEDGCIVLDKYHRWYFYKVRSGDMLDSIPDIVRIDSTLYWELVQYITQDKMIVEQYDVVGLVDTNDVIITHTAVDQAEVIAPVVQLIHNNKVKTSEIIVSVVSPTQIRLKTAQTTAYTNLKANLYITKA